MRVIRASEINSYLYCQRSWMYRLQGIEPANREELLSGTKIHEQHGRLVVGSGLLRIFAWLLFSVALFLATRMLLNL